MSIEMSDAMAAIRRLNPHPEAFAAGRWIEEKKRYEFPMVKRALPGELIREHLIGKRMIGAVGADGHGSTNVVGLDVDAHHEGQHPAQAAQKFVAVAQAFDVPVIMHTSKSGKGLHVRTLFKSYVPSFFARALYMALIVSAGLKTDSSVDKIWPPPTGLGVLAMPYNFKAVKEHGGTLAVDPNTMQPYKRAQQFDAVLEAGEMSDDEVVGVLESFGMRTEKEQMIAAGVPAGLDPRKSYAPAENQDGLVEMVNNCAAVEYVMRELETSTISRNFWWSMMTNFKPFKDGKRIYEAMSSADERRFEKKVFDKQWESVKGKPRLCENLDPGNWECPKRDTCPARAPAGLGTKLFFQKLREKREKRGD